MARSPKDNSIVMGTDSRGEICLPDQYANISLAALNVSARNKIALHMNNPSDILSDSNHLVCDYNGLAELVGFQFLEIKHFGRQKSPSEELLSEWCMRRDLEPTLGKLWDCLKQLGRFDVLEECQPYIIRDAETHIKRREKNRDDYIPQQSNYVFSTSDDAMDHDVDEYAVLCNGDVEYGEPQYFDAYVSYNTESEDIRFVRQMISVLENEPHNLKLFVPNRDDLPGEAKFQIFAKLIETRCQKMVVILSKSYHESIACKFQLKCAQSLEQGDTRRKLIPVVIERGVETPSVLCHMTVCDFTRSDLVDWTWIRLAKAIKPITAARDRKSSSSSPPSSSTVASLSLPSPPAHNTKSSALKYSINTHQDTRKRPLASECDDTGYCGQLDRMTTSDAETTEAFELINSNPKQFAGQTQSKKTKKSAHGTSLTTEQNATSSCVSQ